LVVYAQSLDSQVGKYLTKVYNHFSILLKLLVSLLLIETYKSLPCRLVIAFDASGRGIRFLGVMSSIEFILRKTEEDIPMKRKLAEDSKAIE
jgi:hypothetical protein